MKKLYAVILVCLISVSMTAFDATSVYASQWISPMLAVNVSKDNAGVFAGGINIPIFTGDRDAAVGQPVLVDSSDFGARYRGLVAIDLPDEDQPVVPAKFSGADLEALGAVKMTADFAYGGNEDINVRFRFRVDRFQGHSITQYALNPITGILILWQDMDGNWWNVRRTGVGGEFTGGVQTSGWLYPDTHATLAGEPYPVFTFTINKENADFFSSADFYILVLEGVPLRTNDEGVTTDHTGGYVVTFQAEAPDGDGHFHNFSVLASATTYIHAPAR